MRRFPWFTPLLLPLTRINIPDNRPTKGKTYTSSDMDSMLREMTGKSKSEKRKILKKYGRK